MRKAVKAFAGLVGYPLFGVLDALGGVVQAVFKTILWFPKYTFWLVSFLACSITTASRWIIKPFDRDLQLALAGGYLGSLGVMSLINLLVDNFSNPIVSYIVYGLLILNLYSIAYEYGRWRHRETQKADEPARAIDPAVIDRAGEIRDEIMAIQRPLRDDEIGMFLQKIRAAEDRGEIKPAEVDKLYEYLFTRNDAVAP